MNRNSAVVIILVSVAAFTAGNFYHKPSETIDQGDMTGSANIVAASKTGEAGALGKVRVEAVEGNGDNLIETDPFIQADTQFSASKARRITERITDRDLDNYDLIYQIEMDSKVVGGPSAGAAMTLATIAAVTDKKVRKDAVITGTITRSGRIGKVGEIPVKATTAGKQGLDKILVPEGQATKVNYKPVLDEERRGIFIYRDIEYQREVLNISKYTKRQCGMETREVANIYQAANQMLK